MAGDRRVNLKHCDCLNLIPNCPPSYAAPENRRAFRFVHAELEHENNFLPPAILKPSRVFPEDQRCDALALSMFNSVESAVAEFTELAKTVRHIRKAIGSHLAEGTIDTTHGMVTPVEASGHFNLFAADSAEFTGCFTIAMEL